MLGEDRFTRARDNPHELLRCLRARDQLTVNAPAPSRELLSPGLGGWLSYNRLSRPHFFLRVPVISEQNPPHLYPALAKLIPSRSDKREVPDSLEEACHSKSDSAGISIREDVSESLLFPNAEGSIPESELHILGETLRNIRIPCGQGKELEDKSVLLCIIFQEKIEDGDPGINRIDGRG